MSAPTTSELASRVHDLRAALEQSPLDSAEVRAAAQAVLDVHLPLSQRDTVDLGADVGRKGPATWAPNEAVESATWSPDLLEAGTWAPGKLDEPTDEVEAPETQWEQGPGAKAPTQPLEPPPPVDLEAWCRRILAGETTREDALAALGTWRPASGAADRGGRYVVARELGRGGMGQVVEADDIYLRRTVAIKVLTLGSKSARKRFVEEARLTAMLSHPGVVPVHDVGETPDGKPFFAMKRIHGRSLHQVIHTGGMPRLSERLDVFKRVCEAVAFAHDAGVLHLDLKPDNVMVGDYGEVLVVDWGLATQVGDGGEAVRQVAGTPAYMAPEQATAGAPLDRRTDVYALGAMLFELLTDTVPVDGSDVTEMLDQVRRGAVRSPRSVKPSVPPELNALVQLAMAHDPARRPDNALLLRDEVRAFQEHRELQTMQYGLWSRLDKWRRRNAPLVRGIVGAGAVATLLLAAGALGWIFSLKKALHDLHVQERLARKQQALALLNDGRSKITLERFPEAAEALERAARLLYDLNMPATAPELALAEARATTSEQETHALPITPAAVVTDGAVVLFHGEGRSGWLDLSTGGLHDGPEGASAHHTAFGLAWWIPHEGTLRAFDGSWSVDLPTTGQAEVQHDIVYRLDEGVAFDLARAPDGQIRWTRRPLRPGDCEVERLSVAGPFGSCGDTGNVDLRTGEKLTVRPMQADPTGTYVLVAQGLRVEVLHPDATEVWHSNTRPHQVASYERGIVWRDERDHIRAATWATGRRELTLDASGTPDDTPFAAAPDDQLVVIADEASLHLLRPASRVLASQTSPTEGSPYAIAADEQAVTYLAGGRLRTFALDPQPPPWTDRPIDGTVRDLARSADGTLAVALSRSGVALVTPDGKVTRHELSGCCLSVAWRDGVLGAVGTGAQLHELADGAWTTHELPAFAQGSWSITAFREGWLMSDYRPDKVHARYVVDGDVQEEYRGDATARAFEIASNGSSFVVGTGDGPWLWPDGRPGTRLDASFALAVGWFETGPVAAGADHMLRFYDPQGQELHAWNVDEVISAVSTSPRGIATASMARVRWLPIDLRAMREELRP